MGPPAGAARNAAGEQGLEARPRVLLQVGQGLEADVHPEQGPRPAQVPGRRRETGAAGTIRLS
ncbi:hypothetical protein ABZ871_32015 [Streptomyces populi]